MPPKPKNYVYTFQREALRDGDSPKREDEQSLFHTALKPKQPDGNKTYGFQFKLSNDENGDPNAQQEADTLKKVIE